MNKAIHYLTLVANQNIPQAQNNLGIIYSEGKYIERDVSKAIHYLTLAANQNFRNGQYILGFFYLNGIHLSENIKKSHCYLTLAEQRESKESLFLLGVIVSTITFFEEKKNEIPATCKNIDNNFYDGFGITLT